MGAVQKLPARYHDGDAHARPARLYMHRDDHARVPRDGDDTSMRIRSLDMQSESVAEIAPWLDFIISRVTLTEASRRQMAIALSSIAKTVLRLPLSFSLSITPALSGSRREESALSLSVSLLTRENISEKE